MIGFARFFSRENPLHLAEDRILAEQLRLLMGNVGSSVIPAILLAFLMLWVLSNATNTAGLALWCMSVILSKLICYVHARRHLACGIPFEQTRRLAWELMLLNAVDGVLWGSLAWVTLETSTTAGSILVISVTAGIAGSSMSLLSPVLPVFVIFALAELVALASKVFLLGDPAYNALGVAGILFIATLLGQARNSSRAARVGIDLRFELADSHKRLREIEQRQMLAQERQRLMQDMHDGLGSSLTSALRAAEHGKIKEEDMVLVLKGCIDDLKLAIDSMEPVNSDLLLLLATLRFRLQPRLESTGIVLRWEVQDVPKLEWLEPKSALHILRILQEAFTNIIKHTQASEIRVATRAEGGHVVVSIADNGAGFSVADALNKGGKGLSNQQRRALAIGAEVDWESDKTGTCFTLRLPIRSVAE